MNKSTAIQLGIVSVIAAGMFYIIKATNNTTSVPSAKAAISYSLRQFATGLNDPALMSIDTNGDMYVTQRGYETNGVGKIYKISPTGVVSIFKDNIPTGQSGEKGLLGVEVDNQYVYYYYTNTSGTGNAVGRINKSTKVIEDIFTGIPAGSIHNAGSIHFGLDGKLYVATGNTGNRDMSADINSLGGKILRINADGTIPTDNPFVGRTGHDAIWAYGLRNPFTFNVDSLTGRIFVNDVGDGSWEEINELVKGSNYGYPQCEGKCGISGLIDPIYQFPNPSDESAAITGGAFWKNGYFFSDFKQTDLGWVDRYDLTTKTVTRAIASAPEPFAMDVNPANGKLYMLSGNGVVYEIADSDTSSTPVPTRTPSATPTPMVSNTPPTPQITTPISGTMFTAGQTISFSGSASDQQDGTLPASKLSWEVRLFHTAADPHSHPFQIYNGVASGNFTTPNENWENDHDIWYRITLTATDNNNATATVIRDVFPRKSQLTFATQPAGLQIVWGTQTKTAPFAQTFVEGMRNNLNIVSPQVLNGRTYRFSSWSDGGAQNRTLTVPTNDTVYTATFIEVVGTTPIPTVRPTNTPTPTIRPTSTPVPTIRPTSTTIPTLVPSITSLGNTQLANPIKLDNTNHNILHGIQIRPAQNTSVNSGFVYLGNAQPGTNVGLAIYTNTTSNTPGTLIAKSSPKAVVGGWNQLPLVATLSANTTYWLLTNNNANSLFSNNLSYTSMPSGLRCMYGAMPYNFDGSFPSIFNSIATYCNLYFSMYVASQSTPVISTPTPPPLTQIGTTTILFDGAPLGALTQYPTGITWQSGAFSIVSAWGKFTTRNLSLTPTATQGTMYFDRSTSIVSVEAYNGGDTSSTVTVTCGSQTKIQTISPFTRTTITTGFTGTCLTGTLRSSNGWDTNFDNLVLRQ